MKKILYMSMWLNDASSYYRLMPLEYLNNPEFTIERKPYSGDITFSTFIGYDVLIMERPSSGADLNAIKLAKQCGLKTILDYDDDLLHVDMYNPLYSAYEQSKQTIIDALMEADEVWVSTEGLAHSFRFYAGKKTVVIPNSHNDYIQPIANKKPFNPNTKKAIWRGGASHEADVYERAEDIVKLINKHDDWFFQFIGFRFVYLEQRCGDNYLPVYPMPLLQYFEYMADENPNILIFPLADTLLNRSKSNISWIEATYCGAMYFGNTNLPEFNKKHIQPIDALWDGDNFLNWPVLQEVSYFYNKDSWTEICDTLLLSNVNKIREQRLLEI